MRDSGKSDTEWPQDRAGQREFDTLLLMGHGTRDPEGVAELADLARAVQASVPERHVELGVLEFPGPELSSIANAIDRCVDAGAHHLTALPLLLHQAGHSKLDMPEQIIEAINRHPGLHMQSCPSLGIHPLLLDIVVERALAAACELSAADRVETALLLVGRGASDPEANADFYKVGRLVWERKRFSFVECCFASLADPRVPEGIERCARLGVRRVLVIPYFLSTGVLVKRIAQQARAAAAAHPRLEVVVGGHLGVHPALVEVILERALSTAPEPPLETLAAAYG